MAYVHKMYPSNGKQNEGLMACSFTSFSSEFQMMDGLLLKAEQYGKIYN